MSSAKQFLDLQSESTLERAAIAAHILVVDDELLIRELLLRSLRIEGYVCDSCESPLEALALLSSGQYDLLISDIVMPEMRGDVLMKEAQRACPDLAVILVTSVTDIEVAVGSLTSGAYDFITKPFSLNEVSISVARALEKRRLVLQNREYERILEEQVESRNRQLHQALDVLHHTYHSTLLALGTALDSREADSEGHSLRVTLYATRLAKELGLDETELPTIERGALLHDLGNIGVPDDILRKPGSLTESEWLLIRKHPEIGFSILSGIKFLEAPAKLVLQHQERYDGSGYPAGLKGEEILLGARIFAVVDTLDCMTSNRPFQTAVCFEAAQEEIMRLAGTQLDPHIVARFLDIPLAVWKEIRSATDNREKSFSIVGGQDCSQEARAF